MHAPSKLSAATVAGLFLAMQASALTVNSPASLTTCQPVLLSWTDADGAAPYYPAIIPGGQSAAAPLKQFPSQTGTSLTWNVDLAAGTSVTIQVTDGAGTINYSSQVTIQAGSDTSCVGSSAAAVAGATTTGASTTRRMTTTTTGVNAATSSPVIDVLSSDSADVSSAVQAAQSSSGASRLATGLAGIAAGALVLVACL